MAIFTDGNPVIGMVRPTRFQGYDVVRFHPIFRSQLAADSATETIAQKHGPTKRRLCPCPYARVKLRHFNPTG